MQYENLDDFIRDLPIHAAHAADKLRGHDLLALVETKQGRRLYIELKDGLAVTMDTADRAPDCTVIAEEAVLLDLICGRLNPAKALLMRRIVVKGSLKLLTDLIALL